MKFFFAFTLAASVAALVIAAPLGPKAEGDNMAELENLASLTALLSKQPASDSDNQVAVQENSQTKETNTPISGMTQVFHGGYTFFRVPFQSSTSSNADILATCKSHGLLAPCDSVATQYAICGGCTEIPIEAHASQQANYHFEKLLSAVASSRLSPFEHAVSFFLGLAY